MHLDRHGRHGPAPRGATPWTVRQAPAAPAIASPLDTRYDIAWLGPDGTARDAIRLGPSTPAFTLGFAAFARGTLLPMPDGPVAVEDARPGDTIGTDGDGRRLLWKGGCILHPGRRAVPLFRLAADALGAGRPSMDLVLGPAARIVMGDASVPVADLADGMNIVRIAPASAVEVFHLGFDGPHRLPVNGLDVESFWPDPAALPGQDGQALFLSMFPHLATARAPALLADAVSPDPKRAFPARRTAPPVRALPPG
ncbi:Hint domain-containing protein [Oceaniovalibus guishaninsula]|uniref:Hint domain-containing protein n=1 Tax=Oceaniovalibus guishaninsula TaxID=1046117 RepID=UPI00030F1941|nr:Hint domain-containing protein [Oceaniovalibus guishaninsula]